MTSERESTPKYLLLVEWKIHAKGSINYSLSKSNKWINKIQMRKEYLPNQIKK